jgi:hypothetical protein
VDSASFLLKLLLEFVTLDSDGVRYKTGSQGEIELEREPSAFDELKFSKREFQLLRKPQ